MIIQLHGTPAATAAARHSLQGLARSWGHDTTDTPVPAAAASRDDPGKAIDPVSLATLALSIPSAALAALDLADRIRKRHRATQLIDHAQQLASQQVNLTLTTQARTTDLATLTPDQLLDLIEDEQNPAS